MDSGAPGVGEIKSFEHDVYVAWKTFGSIDTSSIITDPHHGEVISDVGLKYLEFFEEKSSLRNFLDFSYKFSTETKLMSGQVKELVDYLNSRDNILGSSMAMLGNTAFAFAYDESTFKTLDIEGLHVDKLNNVGIVYD